MRLEAAFFHRDCLEVAPDLVGKILVHRLPDGTELRERIAETEAYRGTEDCLSCCKGENVPDRIAVSGKRFDLCVPLLWHALADECNYRGAGAAAGCAVPGWISA